MPTTAAMVVAVIGRHAPALWRLRCLGLLLSAQSYRRERTGDAWFAVLTSPLVVELLPAG